MGGMSLILRPSQHLIYTATWVIFVLLLCGAADASSIVTQEVETIGDCARACFDDGCSFILYDSDSGTDKWRDCTLYPIGSYQSCLQDACGEPDVTVLFNPDVATNELPSGTNCSTFIYASPLESFEVDIVGSESPCNLLVVTNTQAMLKANVTMQCVSSCLADDILQIHNVWRNSDQSEVVTACYGLGQNLPELRLMSAEGSFALFQLANHSQATFSVSVDSVYITIALAPTDLVILLDNTISFGEVNYILQKNFTADFVAQFTVGPDHMLVAAATYASSAVGQFNLSFSESGSADVQDAIRDFPFDSTTVTSADYAFDWALSTGFAEGNGVRSDASKVILLTIDSPSYSASLTETSADNVKAPPTNAIIYILAIGNDLRMSELEASATDPSYVFLLPDLTDSQGVLENLTQAFINEFDGECSRGCPECHDLDLLSGCLCYTYGGPVQCPVTLTIGNATTPETTTSGNVMANETSTGGDVSSNYESSTDGNMSIDETSTDGNVTSSETSTDGNVTSSETSTGGDVSSNYETSTDGNMSINDTSTSGNVSTNETSTDGNVTSSGDSTTEETGGGGTEVAAIVVPTVIVGAAAVVGVTVVVLKMTVLPNLFSAVAPAPVTTVTTA